MPEDIFENEVEVKADLPQTAEVRQYTSSIEIGNVTTLPAGSQAIVTNTGTETNAILNFGLPKGDAGSMWGELAGDITAQTDLNTILTGLRTDVNAKAPLASPALTGTPTAPTAVDGTDTTQIATTAFVKNAATNLDNSLKSYIQSYVQSYVNTAVANMLTPGNFSNSDTVNVGNNAPYTTPSAGYLLIGYLNLAGNVLINGKSIGNLLYSSSSSGGVNYCVPVKSGTYISVNNASAFLKGIFVPQV